MASPEHTGHTPSLEKSVELDPRDDVEEEEEETVGEEAPQRFSYRKFGVAFLLLAIVVAIILAAVPASVNNGPLNNTQTGFLFFALLAIFLLLLLSCLFCTYYLGGSRDTWEDPVFTGIRFNFSNTTAIIGLFVEFIQVCGFSFHEKATFKGSDDFNNMLYAAVPYKEGRVFNTMYWIMFVMAFSPYIFVVSVRMIIYTINHQRGENDAAQFVQSYQQKIYSILWFLVNTIYIPVISTMMGGIDCTFGDNSADRPQFDSDKDIKCFSRQQLGFMACSLLALVIYYPAASFAQAQTQNISDIKFKPKIVFIFVQGKVVLAGMYVFFASNHRQGYLSVVLAVDLIFLVLNIWAKPCLVQWVNQMRTIFFTVSAWTTICSIISLSDSIDDRVPLGLLIAGWIVCIIGLPIFFFLKHTFGDCAFLPSFMRSSNSESTSSNNTRATTSTPA
jgi:hypothetical protein